MGYMRVELEDIYFENINTYSSDGSLFYFNEDMIVNMKNVYANNVYGIGIGGLFINTINTKNLIITAYNVTLSNSYIASSRTSSVFIWLTGGTFKAEKVTIKNTGGDCAGIIIHQSSTSVEITDLYIDEFNSKIPTSIFSDEEEDYSKVSLKVTNAEIKNIKSRGALFYFHGSNGELKNITAHNIHTCYKDDSCNRNTGSNIIQTKSSIMSLNSKSTVSIEDSTFSNIYGEWGFGNSHSSQTELRNVTIKDGYEKNGIFYFNKDDTSSGMFNIYNSTFLNNNGIKGSVIHIKNVLETNYRLTINNSTFYNNHSSMYGGVIYSVESNTNKNVHFDNCKFKNNTAQYGNLAYSLNENSEPIFTFNDSQTLQDLKSGSNMFASNPTELIINNDSYFLDSILSGDTVNETIIVNIYDDYNSQLSFGNINTLNMDEIVFYEISIKNNEESSNQAEVIGQTKGYCLDDACLINNLHVVGDPGHYTLLIKLLTFGAFSKFEKNHVSMDFDILACDESKYIFQVKEHESIKSCYMPTCSISCNNGKCVNDNVCDCSKTTFTGLYCDEHYKVERIKIFDILYRIIAIIITIITILCIFGIYRYKNNPIIKGGGIQFLILILIGIFFNCGYIYTLTMERTNFICFYIYFLKNMGFSLVFGSIFVKTFRIYIIFKHVRKSASFQLYKMFSIIGGIVIYHLLLLSIWIKLDGIKSTPVYSINNYEYIDCQYHKSHVLSVLFNLVVLIMGIALAYSIRHVNENFQEQLAIPIYVYGIYSFFEITVEYIENIPLGFKDGIRNIAMIIYTIVILYYLYIEKFYIIYYSKNKNTEGKNRLLSPKSPFATVKNKNVLNINFKNTHNNSII
ncbi:7 transmembrane sweet-taste receptor of 3 GCPR-domain-containing protein [Neocallimastix sp. 'constans']